MLKALDIITVQIQIIVKGKKSRRCKQIVEITGLESRTGISGSNKYIQMESLDNSFEKAAESSNDQYHATMSKGWGMDQLLDEIDNRKAILQYMVKNNIRITRVSQISSETDCIDPKEVITNMKNDRLKEFVKS